MRGEFILKAIQLLLIVKGLFTIISSSSSARTDYLVFHACAEIPPYPRTPLAFCDVVGVWRGYMGDSYHSLTVVIYKSRKVLATEAAAY